MRTIAMRAHLIAAILLSSVALPVGAPAIAQQSGAVVTLRVDKLEKEMKAVQRKVFPGGVALEPEIGGANTPGSLAGTSASTPVADLTARVDALEAQLGSITNQVEQAGFRVKKLEDASKAMDARLKAMEAPAVEKPAAATEPSALQATPKPAVATPTPKPPAPKPVVTTPKPTTTALTKPTTTATVTKPIVNDPKRAAAIKAAVQIPVTSDPLDDAYSYGYRLWAAKFYPEAEAQLKDFVAKNPKHKKASAAQMFLGRAYLDEGKPGLASVAFFENYQKNPKGERAAESLYWLGASLTKLKKLPDACKVYQEFDDVYGETAPAPLKARVVTGRVDAQCAK
jgi:TolA-binding protein